MGNRTRIGTDGHIYELVFSDEFNEDGRTFWPGDDPYWEAGDMHYWSTRNLEVSAVHQKESFTNRMHQWYSPRQVTTNDGSLRLTLNETKSHNLNFEGAMLTSCKHHLLVNKTFSSICREQILLYRRLRIS